MATSDPTVKRCCKAHLKGKVLPDDRRHVLRMLGAEGHKRVESFLFEQIFLRHVTNCVGADHSCSGWLYQYGDKGQPHYWFRLVSESNPWTEVCDEKVKELALRTGGEVTAVEFDSGKSSFLARRFRSGNWTDKMPLRQAMRELTGREEPKGAPRNYGHIDFAPQREAIRFINALFSDQELADIAASRLLINCHVYPWFEQQPMDIDACIVSEHDKLRLIEFKRKYPTRKKTFGLDESPHGELVDWLEEVAHPLLHLLLVDPLWDRNESPIHMLRPLSPTTKYARWIGVEIGSDAFTDSGFRTSGSDSGMTGGHREQREIAPTSTMILGDGLQPDKLCQFVNRPSSLDFVDVREDLERVRDLAREDWQSWQRA